MKRENGWVFNTVVLILVLSMVSFMGYLVYRNITLNNENSVLSQDVTDLREQVHELGSTPVVPAPAVRDGAPGTQGPRGEAGAPGRPPTTAEILGAINTYCEDGRCVGPAGKDSVIPGPPGTPGTNGTNGLNGADSTVPGPAGPAGEPGRAPTAEEISAAVSAYCSVSGNCTTTGVVTCPSGYTFQVFYTTVRGESTDGLWAERLVGLCTAS